jgi:hypothetical protein
VDADGRVPQSALAAAALRRDLRRWERDLVRGGVVPISVGRREPLSRLG